MMTFAFDLISDLHVEDNPPLDWQDQATSTMCLVAGDVSRDTKQIKTCLTQLSDCYQAVFYIDGNNEHAGDWDHLPTNHTKLARSLKRVGDNTIFLYNRTVIINDVAILAVNGWFTYDYLENISIDTAKLALCDYLDINMHTADYIEHLAHSDVDYLNRSVAKLQKYIDVKKIIIMTHTPPLARFVENDPDLASSWRLNTTVNRRMSEVLSHDKEKKIKAWCFGHYHWPVDETVDGVRYVCNPLGRSTTPWHRSPYFAKRIEI